MMDTRWVWLIVALSAFNCFAGVCKDYALFAMINGATFGWALRHALQVELDRAEKELRELGLRDATQ